MSGPVFVLFFSLFFVLFLGGGVGYGCLSNAPFTAASSRTPDEWVQALSSLFLCFFFALFSVFFFWVGEGS